MAGKTRARKERMVVDDKDNKDEKQARNERLKEEFLQIHIQTTVIFYPGSILIKQF